MKKITVFVFLALAALSTHAQTQKNNMMVGGDVAGLGAYFMSGSNIFSLNLHPMAGLFIKDNIVVGTALELGFASVSGSTSISYGIAPFGRYYSPKGTATKWFGEASIGFSGVSYSGTATTGSSSSSFAIGAGPGIAHFLTPNVGLEALLKVNYVSGGGSSLVAPFIGLGFHVYLDRKVLKL